MGGGVATSVQRGGRERVFGARNWGEGIYGEEVRISSGWLWCY